MRHPPHLSHTSLALACSPWDREEEEGHRADVDILFLGYFIFSSYLCDRTIMRKFVGFSPLWFPNENICVLCILCIFDVLLCLLLF